MKWSLILSIYLLSSVSMHEKKLKLSIVKTLKGRVDEMTFLDDRRYVTSTTGSIMLWEQDKKKGDYSIPGYIRGQFYLHENILTSGVVQYDLHTHQPTYHSKYIAALVSTFAPHYQGREDQFEVSYSLPVPAQDRLILALHFRPTRNPTRKDPFPIPQDVVGLLKLSDATLVSVLDSGSLYMRKPQLVGSTLYYGCNQLQCWDIVSGRKKATFTFSHPYELASWNSGVAVFLQNGEVWAAEENGDIKKQGTLPFTVRYAVQLPGHQAFAVGDESKKLHMVTLQDSTFTVTQSLKLDNNVNGIYMAPDGKHLYVPLILSDTFLKLRIDDKGY